MPKRRDIAKDVQSRLAVMTPAHRREAIEALQAVIAAELMNSAAAGVEVACCPCCGSVSICKNGHDAFGAQRWRCNDCGKTFTAATGTILGSTKLKPETWRRYVECFVDRLSLRECAQRCGVGLKTSFFMRHRIIECIFKSLPSFQVESGCSAELDETFFRESFKGNHDRSAFRLPRPPRHHGGKLHTRGVSNEQICVMTGINDFGDIFYEVAKRGPLSKDVAKNVLTDKIRSGAIISTDKAAGYRIVLPQLGVIFYEVAKRGPLSKDVAKNVLTDKIRSGAIISTDKAAGYRIVLPQLGVAAHNAFDSKDRSQGVINRINAVHSLLNGFMERFRGVSTRHLGAYLAWFKWTRSFDRKDGALAELAMKQVAQLLNGFMERFRGVSTRHLGAYLAWFKWTRSFDRKDGALAELAMKQVAQGTYDTKWRDYKNAPYLFMDYWEKKTA